MFLSYSSPPTALPSSSVKIPTLTLTPRLHIVRGPSFVKKKQNEDIPSISSIVSCKKKPIDIVTWIEDVSQDPDMDPLLASFLQYILKNGSTLLHTLAAEIHYIVDHGTIHIYLIPEIVRIVKEVLNYHSDMLSESPFTLKNVIEAVRLLLNLLMESDIFYVPEKKICLRVLNTSIYLLESSLDIPEIKRQKKDDACCGGIFSFFLSFLGKK